MDDLTPVSLNAADRMSAWQRVTELAGVGVSRTLPDTMKGGRRAALAALAEIDPRAYAASRNHLDGAVTRLSPYIRHGVLSLDEVRNHAIAAVRDPREAEKFVQELAWRDYWQRIYPRIPTGSGMTSRPTRRDPMPASMNRNCPVTLRKPKRVLPASTSLPPC